MFVEAQFDTPLQNHFVSTLTKLYIFHNVPLVLLTTRYQRDFLCGSLKFYSLFINAKHYTRNVGSVLYLVGSIIDLGYWTSKLAPCVLPTQRRCTTDCMADRGVTQFSWSSGDGMQCVC